MSNFKFNNNGILAIWNRVLVLLKMITGDVDVIGKGTIQDQLDYLYTHDSSHKTVTTEEFNALTDEEKDNGTIYFISDGNITGSGTSGNGSIPLLDGADPNNILDVPVCRMINATGSIPFVATGEENVNDFILQTHWYKDIKTNEQRATQLAFSLIDGTIKNRIFNGSTWADWSAGMGTADTIQSRNFFVGTQAEFDEAYDAGKLDVGAIVIITDQDEVYIEGQGTVVVDQSFITTSKNPIANGPVATKFGEHDAEIAALKKTSSLTTTSIKTVTEAGLQAVDATQLNPNVLGSLAYNIEALGQFKYNMKRIGSGADLDTYKTPGDYYCPLNDYVVSLKHRPEGIGLAFRMKVYYALSPDDGGYIAQEITTYITGMKYYRVCETGVWHEWYTFGTAKAINTVS